MTCLGWCFCVWIFFSFQSCLSHYPHPKMPISLKNQDGAPKIMLFQMMFFFPFGDTFKFSGGP